MYHVFFEKNAEKYLRKMDPTQQKILIAWVAKNLENTKNPRAHGQPLKGVLKDYWRYRVGDYRLIAEIDDNEIRIIIIKIGHRRDIYG
ncbi:MAG: type II toxin-antitoxin system RelE/ParE family toxin [Clostridiales bacterium]|jgi:mRNA interferase RelE/StbE|nr:type II toxin-antitoxin system RelE/ParE family toxin [Clostridiales bacterium]